MKTPILAGEKMVKSGRANMQRGIETVGGRLYLTNQRLVFESHSLNFRTGATILPIASVHDARKCWTKFLNLIPLFPNSILVTTLDHQLYRFVTYGRESWIEAMIAVNIQVPRRGVW
jgi:hypothetical protein